jgi:glycosyltransferase involved in cell wall biosynthesis
MNVTIMAAGAEKMRAGASGVSVVIPVYRSEKILPELLRRLCGTLAAITAKREIILVNDSSPDDSWEIIGQLAAQYPEIKPINLMRNYGQHNALLCGIRTASCDTIVTMDDDLQHPPEEIPKLLAELTKDWDVVYGIPEKQEHGLLRDVASITTKLALQRVMGAEIARNVCAFRAFRREVAASFAHYEGSFVSIDVLLTWGTNRFAAVPVRHQPRAQGISGYTFRKLVAHAMNMMTGFTTMPLKLASWVGFGFTLLSMGVIVYVGIRYLVSGNPVPGFPFLASILGLFSGAQLFALGIIGEYLARVHLRSMQKPPYVVRQFGLQNQVQNQAKKAGAGSI